MKSLFAAFRPVAAGQSLNQEATDGPSSRDHEQGKELDSTPDHLRMTESAGHVPYPKRLRVILALALFSWAMFALVAWAILGF